MFEIIKDPTFAERDIPLGILEVTYPDRSEWNEKAFYDLVHAELDELRGKYPDYDRKAVFGENPYFRFFKKFKKTYPVMQQFESVMFKGRPFPEEDPVMGVPFLLELTTFILSGTHDLDRMDGPLTIFTPSEKLPFSGMRSASTHTYPHDICGRDNSGIIFSMIAGADDRTCIHPDSRHVFYPVFGTPDTDKETIQDALQRLEFFVKVLAPNAEIESTIV